ncbi:hypothetical protein HDK77DRAFT_47006 [Phyllosticta capitalensis]|uniref:Secreted protein n=1 Tax=Phyllosticta capitalensis TaxID=121624 RepID=A0ABR1YAP1_9PEZI
MRVVKSRVACSLAQPRALAILGSLSCSTRAVVIPAVNHALQMILRAVRPLAVLPTSGLAAKGRVAFTATNSCAKRGRNRDSYATCLRLTTLHSGMQMPHAPSHMMV